MPIVVYKNIFGFNVSANKKKEKIINRGNARSDTGQYLTETGSIFLGQITSHVLPMSNGWFTIATSSYAGRFKFCVHIN